MAYRVHDEQGYDEKRFEGRVREDLFCSICKEVLRNPRTCQREHLFCLSCISQYLVLNSHTCPECRDHLTPETLKDPPRFLKNTLSVLKIKCDYNEQGCLGYVQLGNLQNHIEQCGFAPVMCGNEGCGTVVNKRDKEIHERELCQFRIPKCHDCRDIKASQDEMKASQDEMKGNVEDMKENQDVMKQQLNEIMNAQEEYQVSINRQLNKRKHDQMEENVDAIKQTQDVINVKVNQMKDEMKVELNEMKDKITGMERTQDRMKQSVDEMKQQFENMMIMVQQALQGSDVNNNAAQAINPAVPDNNQDIIILGGQCAAGPGNMSNTVEKYSIAERKSTQLPGMNLARADSASCVYNGDVIVAGGWDGQAATDSIEILKMNQHPLRWTMFDGKLPVKLSGHDIIVYQDKLYIIGGDNWNKMKPSDAIYELSLAPPYTAKLLAKMPQPRKYHGAEIVNGKLFIFGGTTTGAAKDATDTVVVYDFITNNVTPCPLLPKRVSEMSTVTWGNTVILVGGLDKNGQVLNDVFMYSSESGLSERLPSLKHKRRGASAVIMHDVIVVLGGRNDKEYLNSVESFTMRDDQWKELPGMKEKRYYANAVVKPRN